MATEPFYTHCKYITSFRYKSSNQLHLSWRFDKDWRSKLRPRLRLRLKWHRRHLGLLPICSLTHLACSPSHYITVRLFSWAWVPFLSIYLFWTHPNPTDFIRQFVLYTIGVILAPTTKDHVDSKYLAYVEKVWEIPKYNWGQLTLSNLLSCVQNFKNKKIANLQGNLALLQVSATSLLCINFPSVVYTIVSVLSTPLTMLDNFYPVLVLGACTCL
jgi:hypothetical protein